MQCDGFEGSPVFVFGDGPRSEDEIANVVETRSVAKSLLGNRAEYHFRDKNAGLARSVIDGVNDVVGRFGRAIVIEDDLELAPLFLTYMNRALDRFADDDRVWQVSAYMFDVPEFRTRSQALFLPMTTSWGWATWKRAWEQFDPLATGWTTLRTNKSLRRRFDLDGSYDYSTMLKRQMSGQLDSWAIRWYWSFFKNNGLTIFPPVTLVRNHGFDGSGSHGIGIIRSFSGLNCAFPLELPEMPIIIGIDEGLKSVAFRAMRRVNGGTIGRVYDCLRRMWY